MPIQRWWRLRKLIRDTTTPIPLAKAEMWDKRLGIAYNVSALMAAIIAAGLWMEQTNKRNLIAEKMGVKPETSGEYWVRTLDLRDVKILSIGGPDGMTTKSIGNPQEELKRPEYYVRQEPEKKTGQGELLED